nr:PREDICTED: uncharacterized protein LOC102689927 isoform X3 [Lepisosteus oculatus]
MSSAEIYDLPLNVYVIILGIGLFIFMLSMIFCCYLFRLRRHGRREQYGYNEVVLKGAGKKLSLLGVPGEVAGNPQCLSHVQQANLSAGRCAPRGGGGTEPTGGVMGGHLPGRHHENWKGLFPLEDLLQTAGRGHTPLIASPASPHK